MSDIHQSLEHKLSASGNTVELLRNLPVGSSVFPVVPSEFSNWRDEQLAVRNAAVLLDQSHHMVSLFIEGPDALRLLSGLAVNSFAGFAVDKAKQLVVCNYDGMLIGDGILFHLAENEYSYVGNPAAANWIRFHADTGDYDVTIEVEDRSPSDLRNANVSRRYYRYEIQGPLAKDVIEKLTGAPFPEIRLFNMGTVTVEGREVRALRHGMAGAPGLELFGPYEDREQIRLAILAAGEEFGLRQVGSRAYPTLALESAWMGWPLPAVYSGESMKAYREWLPSSGYEGSFATLGGSFLSENIEDYYVTPYELGYGAFIKFDHEFIGRDALERMADQTHRRKVTLAWNRHDVAKVFASLFDPDTIPFKHIELPRANYTSVSFDRVTLGDRTVGFSSSSGYTHNERSMLSMAVIEADVPIGEEVVLLWGEENGGTAKTSVERHQQTTIRAIVSPAPYSKVAREDYANTGWRTAAR
ncbi:aminomethyl transferase family protein [Naasia lichenicola]|uniref:Aminomethyl transferase family protein n=2 Tax=Naasia lichenicola TaxID=2565933 RepID=A0A4S4FIS2_9MICO|nr:aminomethyl transferase family protein [Naasia lichenicola]